MLPQPVVGAHGVADREIFVHVLDRRHGVLFQRGDGGVGVAVRGGDGGVEDVQVGVFVRGGEECGVGRGKVMLERVGGYGFASRVRGSGEEGGQGGGVAEDGFQLGGDLAEAGWGDLARGE